MLIPRKKSNSTFSQSQIACLACEAITKKSPSVKKQLRSYFSYPNTFSSLISRSTKILIQLYPRNLQNSLRSASIQSRLITSVLCSPHGRRATLHLVNLRQLAQRAKQSPKDHSSELEYRLSTSTSDINLCCIATPVIHFLYLSLCSVCCLCSQEHQQLSSFMEHLAQLLFLFNPTSSTSCQPLLI